MDKIKLNKYERWIVNRNRRANIYTCLLFLILGGFMIGYNIIIIKVIKEALDYLIVWTIGLILYPILFFVPLALARIYAGFQKEDSYKAMGPDAFSQYIKRMQDFNRDWYGKEFEESITIRELNKVVEKINQKQLPFEEEK